MIFAINFHWQTKLTCTTFLRRRLRCFLLAFWLVADISSGPAPTTACWGELWTAMDNWGANESLSFSSSLDPSCYDTMQVVTTVQHKRYLLEGAIGVGRKKNRKKITKKRDKRLNN